jgi:DNA-binding NarL/FixJ family response regulator
MIRIALLGNKKLILNGIQSMLVDNDDFDVIDIYYTQADLLGQLNSNSVNILILSIDNFNSQDIEFINHLRMRYANVRVLIVGDENENCIMQTLKAGAKGFITFEADRNELVEAVYTIRNGFDYYSKSISRIFINNYIHNNTTPLPEIEKLSKRELEVLQYWGEGFTNPEIADKLSISIRTIESHKNHIMQKINLRTTVDLLKFAIKNNIIKI